jgi:hypothetical protein
MRKVQGFVGIILLLCFLAMPSVSILAAEPPRILKLGTTVALKTKEGIQIKKWLDLLSERLNNAGGLVVRNTGEDRTHLSPLKRPIWPIFDPPQEHRF